MHNTRRTPAGYRSHYRPSVQLVSACCQLELPGQPLLATEVADMLQLERKGKLPFKQVKQLDTLTDKLVWAMTSDQLPRGSRGGNNISLTANDYLSLLRERKTTEPAGIIEP